MGKGVEGLEEQVGCLGTFHYFPLGPSGDAP